LPLIINGFHLLSAAQRDKECDMKKVQRDARAQRVEMLRAIATWEGQDPDRAARLRAEARTLAKDPDFADMVKQAACCAEIANTVTAKKEAKRDRQSTKAKMPRPRPWHVAAGPILAELREKHPDLRPSGLRRKLEKRLERLGVEFPGAQAIVNHIEQREKNGSLAARRVK
jgi:hypothetical protein